MWKSGLSQALSLDRGALLESVTDSYEHYALTKHVKNGTMRTDEAVLLWRRSDEAALRKTGSMRIDDARRTGRSRTNASPRSPPPANFGLEFTGQSMFSLSDTSLASPSKMTLSQQRFFSKQDKQVEEIRLARASEELFVAFRRLCSPEYLGHNWTLANWAAVAQVLARLRGLAHASGWLPRHASSQSLSGSFEATVDSPSMEDFGQAGPADAGEGMLEARILRMACFLSQSQPQGPLRDLQSKLSEEVRALSGISLAQFRECGVVLGRLMDAKETESQKKLDRALADSYAGFARNMAVLRQRLGDEMHHALQETQAPLWSAAVAARSLPSGALADSLAHEVTAFPGPGFRVFEQGEGDSFGPLHQNVLLSCLSSLAEVAPGQGGSWGKSEEDRRLERVLERVLSSSQGAPESAGTGDPPHVASFNVEFTTAQLRRMQRAVRDRDPQVAGAQGLLQDTLDRYSELARAMVAAYGDESILRASPAEVAQHEALLGLVRELRELWRDAGALLEASRRADLLALERVRVRHRKVVLNAFRKGGDEAAAVVLARLALVDEMLEDPSERRFTKSVPLTMRKSYELVEGIVASLGVGGADAPARQPHRRRRWLRCPHCTTHVVVAGEVWCQLMHRFLYAEAAFDPVSALGREPLSQREFRILSVLLELQMSERTCNVVYESAVDLTQEITGDAAGQATVAGLQELVHRYGERGSGDLGIVVSAALSAAWVGVHSMYEDQRSPGGQKERVRRTSHMEVEGEKVRKALKTRAAKRKSIFAARPRPGGRDVSPGGEEREVQSKTSGGKSKKSFVSAIARALGKTESDARTPWGHQAEQSAQHKKAAAPMVCQRCLAGDMPNFPHVSVGVLSRDNFARGGGSPEPGGSPAPDFGTAARPRETTSNKRGPGGGHVPSVESFVHADMGDELIEEQFGEDMVLSMATSVLASSILLCKDERGAYFRWLARIVLYSSTSVLERSEATPQPREATPHGHRTGNVPAARERGPHLGRDPGIGDPLPSLSKPSTPLHAATIATGLALAATSHGGHELEDGEDMQADPALPEPILKALRHDCGLSHPNDKRDGLDESPPTRDSFIGLDLKEARRTMALRMFDDVQDRFAKGGTSIAHRLKRKARAARLVVGLRALNVDAHATQNLQRELQGVAESTVPSFTGAILVGGAARAAQFLLKPNGISRHRTHSRPQSQQGHIGQGAQESPGGPGRAAAGETGLLTAAEVVQLNSSSALQCYDQVGLGCSLAQQRVAAALQFLERQVFPQAHNDPDGGGPAQTQGAPNSRRRRGGKIQELTRTIAPLLLPADLARKLGGRRGQDEAAARGAPEESDQARRCRSVRNTEDRTVAFQEAQRIKSDAEAQGAGSQRPEPSCDASASPPASPTAGQASPGAARSPREGQHRARRPRALAHLAQCVQDAEADLADDPLRRPVVKTPPQPPPLCPKSASSPCLFGPPCPAEAQHAFAFAESSTEWHPEVRGLLDTVSTRGRLMRSTVSTRSVWPRRGGVQNGQRSVGAKLPAVVRAERRGGGGAVAIRDPVLTDGWRAKLPPDILGRDRPKSRALQPQVELASGRPFSRSTPGGSFSRGGGASNRSPGSPERGSSPLRMPVPQLPGPAAVRRKGP